MKKINAFTLAEMMIVMLILTILLAAFAPLMTRKAKVDLSNPWRWANNNSDIYYGMGNNQTAMIGQNNKAATDPSSKLLINTGGDNNRAHILFKSNNNILGNLIYDGTNLLFGGPFSQTMSGSQNTAFGALALSQCTGTNCERNTAFGNNTLSSLSQNSINNTAIGVNALMRHTNSANPATLQGNNVAVGAFALLGAGTEGAAHTGYNNTAVGSETGRRITSGHDNTAVGFAAGGAGQWAGEVANTGSFNTSLGSSSLLSNTTGKNNTAIGYQALQKNTTGANNIAIGADSCQNVTIGSNKVCIGNGSGPKNNDSYKDTTKKIIYLGDNETTVYIPGHLVVDKFAILGKEDSGYQTYIRLGHAANAPGADHYWLTALRENSSTTIGDNGQNLKTRLDLYTEDPPFALPGTTYYMIGIKETKSDKRLKNIKGESTAGLEQIKKLEVFHFTYKKDEAKTPHVGVIAQDLQKIFPDAVTTGEDGYLMIRMEDMFYASINAIKELDKMLQNLIVQVKALATQVANHDTQIKALQKENKELKTKVKNLEKRLDAIEKKL